MVFDNDAFYDEYYNDPYHTPHKFGLTVVAEAELSEPFYSFDIAMVWYHEESKSFYVAQDSGCSCPSPFENFETLSNLTGPYDKTGVIGWLKNFSAEDPDQIVRAIEKVMEF